MRSLMKLGKDVKDPTGGNCLDRISSLPDELLGHTLSFLPTRCAVSTSILSKRWRYLFTLMTNLSFEDELCNCDSEEFMKIEAAQRISFKKFVDKVLRLHQIAPIKKFSLVCRGPYDESDLNEWVGNAVQKGVQEFQYHVIGQDLLPDGLFMCETVVRLKIIYGDYGIEFPLSTRLPRLKVLHLEWVKFVDYSVERLFSSCKLLEELSLVCCGYDMDWDCQSGHVIIFSGVLKVLTIRYCYFEEGLFEIDAPNLAYLTYCCNTGVKIVPSWKYSCSFVESKLSFNCRGEDESNYDLRQYDRGLLNAAANKVTDLYLSWNAVKLLTLADHEQMPDFHSLLRLRVNSFSYDAWKYVTSLLDKSPQLEYVDFEWGLHRCDSDPATPPDEPLIPFSCHVKEIVVRIFCGHECSLLLLGHLLRNAGALKKLTVFNRRTVNTEEELRISKCLLMLPRASSDFCIELKPDCYSSSVF